MIVGMERAQCSSWMLGMVLGYAGCVGGQTGESPGDPMHTGGDAACEAQAACSTTKPSAEELSAFGSQFGGETGDYEIHHTVGEAVERPTFIATGTLIGVEDGRKSYHGEVCDWVGADEREPPPDPCPSWIPSFGSFINLVIRTDSVLRGEVAIPGEDLRVELRWPNNLPLDGLVASAPLGARLLLLSHWVENAQEEAAPLEEAGILAPGSVADNLLTYQPYGVAFEDAEGLVSDAFYGEELALLLDAGGGAVRFDDLVSAVSAAVQ
jgi:hypothetical protein